MFWQSILLWVSLINKMRGKLHNTVPPLTHKAEMSCLVLHFIYLSRALDCLFLASSNFRGLLAPQSLHEGDNKALNSPAIGRAQPIAMEAFPLTKRYTIFISSNEVRIGVAKPTSPEQLLLAVGYIIRLTTNFPKLTLHGAFEISF